MSLLDGDIAGVDLRANTSLLIAAVKDAYGRPLDPLFRALAQAAPVALAEVVCGPRAAVGPTVARAALPYAEVLEGVLSPRGFYPRLAELSGEAAGEVLATAARRHPAASWLLPMGRKIEGENAGLTQLSTAASLPMFAAVCQAHAEARNVSALLLVAGRTGRAEPAAALLAVDPTLALRAAAAAMDANPDAPILPHFAAVWGPEPDALALRLLPHIRSRAAARSLLVQSRHLPRTAALLNRILPGLA